MTKALALALAATTLLAPTADAGQIVCKYYKVYNPVNGQVYTYDLTWCPV